MVESYYISRDELTANNWRVNYVGELPQPAGFGAFSIQTRAKLWYEDNIIGTYTLTYWTQRIEEPFNLFNTCAMALYTPRGEISALYVQPFGETPKTCSVYPTYVSSGYRDEESLLITLSEDPSHKALASPHGVIDTITITLSSTPYPSAMQ